MGLSPDPAAHFPAGRAVSTVAQDGLRRQQILRAESRAFAVDRFVAVRGINAEANQNFRVVWLPHVVFIRNGTIRLDTVGVNLNRVETTLPRRTRCEPT